MVISVPVPADQPAIGLSIHRFYRGINHEVHGVECSLPHPLDPCKFLVCVLCDTADRRRVFDDYVASARAAAEQCTQDRLADARARIARAQTTNGPRASLATVKSFALKHADMPPPPDPTAGLWNETYYQCALIDLWELERDRRWLQIVIPRMEHALAHRTDRSGKLDPVRGVVLPTWYGDAGEPWAMTLVTGVILNPIARMMRTVHDDAELRDLAPRVARWMPASEEAIDAHGDEWVELGDGAGTYLEPYAKGPRRVYPTGGSRPAPFNRASLLAMPMLNLGRVLGRSDYVEKATKFAVHFKRSCQTLPNGSLVWEYLPGRYPATGEDISHAHCQVLFAELCAAEGIVFDQRDLRALARTLEKNVFRYGDVPCGEVRGLQPELSIAVGAWSLLCRFAPHLLPRIVAVVETAMAEREFDFTGQGWGIRLLTLIEKARRMVRGDGNRITTA